MTNKYFARRMILLALGSVVVLAIYLFFYKPTEEKAQAIQRTTSDQNEMIRQINSKVTRLIDLRQLKQEKSEQLGLWKTILTQPYDIKDVLKLLNKELGRFNINLTSFRPLSEKSQGSEGKLKRSFGLITFQTQFQQLIALLE